MTKASKQAALLTSALVSVLACSSSVTSPAEENSGDEAAGDVAATATRMLGSVTALEVIFQPEPQRSATDLAFNPVQEGELWVVLRELGFDGSPCNAPTETEASDQAACENLVGTVAIIEQAHGEDPIITLKRDANAWHFMRRPSGIDFGPGDTFATCAEHRTANFDDAAADFIGPTLWSSDPKIFGPHGPGGNGSHLDMLHATPYCMGIAHERDNVYWAFNGQVGAVDRYDFREPHEPGGADHSDGEVVRWLLGELSRVPEVPSGLAYEAATGMLYIADTGNRRVVELDTRSGSEGPPLRCDDPQLGHRVDQVVEAVSREVVSAGTLSAPAGLALYKGVLFVSDHETSRIHAFSKAGEELSSFHTGLPPRSLGGVAVGPDARLYITDILSGAVRRLEPR